MDSGMIRMSLFENAFSQVGLADTTRYYSSTLEPGVKMNPGTSWCGIFQLWNLHAVGLASGVFWKPRYGFVLVPPNILPQVKMPNIGDIAYFHKNQHYASVARINTDNSVILINGNGEGGKVSINRRRLSEVDVFFSIEPYIKKHLEKHKHGQV